MDKHWHHGLINNLQKKAFSSRANSCWHRCNVRDNVSVLSTMNSRQLNLEENLEYDPSSECPPTATTGKNFDRADYMLMNNKWLTKNQTANAINISHERVDNILHNELASRGFLAMFSKLSDIWVKSHHRSTRKTFLRLIPLLFQNVAKRRMSVGLITLWLID